MLGRLDARRVWLVSLLEALFAFVRSKLLNSFSPPTRTQTISTFFLEKTTKKAVELLFDHAARKYQRAKARKPRFAVDGFRLETEILRKCFVLFCFVGYT